MQQNLPGLFFLTKKVVMDSTSQGFFFLLAIVYTANASVDKKIATTLYTLKSTHNKWE